MSDIRESGAVEQDADVVILIHREDNDGVPAREAELIVDKNRNGETGIVRVEWAAEQTRFYDFSPGASLRVVK
jgi:replicative DNA helicase